MANAGLFKTRLDSPLTPSGDQFIVSFSILGGVTQEMRLTPVDPINPRIDYAGNIGGVITFDNGLVLDLSTWCLNNTSSFEVIEQVGGSPRCAPIGSARIMYEAEFRPSTIDFNMRCATDVSDFSLTYWEDRGAVAGETATYVPAVSPVLCVF